MQPMAAFGTLPFARTQAYAGRMRELVAIVALLFCTNGCTEDTLSWLCPAGAIRVDGRCEWTYSQLSASANETCALREETGEVVCWGEAKGIAGWPRGVAFSQVASGYFSTCGIVRESGAIRCWGEVEIVDLPTSGSYTQVLVSGGACAIRSDDGTVECWRSAENEQADEAPSGVAFRKLVVGGRGYCGIRRDDGQIQCWGGDWTWLDHSMIPEGEVCSLSAGSYGLGYCGLRCSGEAACFPSGPRTASALVPTDMRFSELDMGNTEVCGVAMDDGLVTCWSNPEEPPAAQPPDIALEQLTVGGADYSFNRSAFFGHISHACALRRDDHRVVCWGHDYAGQVTGIPSTVRYSQIVSRTRPVGGHEPDETMVCGLRVGDGRVTCWGDDGRPAPDREYSAITTECGILAADGRTDCSGAPADKLSELAVSSDGSKACGIRADDHTAICWYMTEEPTFEPVVSDAPRGVALHGLVMSLHHACALRDTDQHVVCWGDDTGEIISGAPSDVAWKQLQIDAIYSLPGKPETPRACGIRASDDVVQCWGAGEATLYRDPPTLPLQQLSGDARCGILRDTREIACWDSEGTATVAPEIQGVRFSALADTFSCGIRASDSQITCWGKVLWNP